MAWSKNVSTYPAAYQELWIRMMETGQESTHRFDTAVKARKFQRAVMAIRYAHLATPGGPYKDKAGAFTAELVDPLTVRICSVDDTERARLGSHALQERREQDKARGIDMIEFAPQPKESAQ